MIHMVVGTPTLNFNLPSNGDPSVVRFECINNDGQPDPSARFEFRNNTRDLIAQRGTDASQSFLIYTITEDSIIRCIVGKEHSNELMFAGELWSLATVQLLSRITSSGSACLTSPNTEYVIV